MTKVSLVKHFSFVLILNFLTRTVNFCESFIIHDGVGLRRRTSPLLPVGQSPIITTLLSTSTSLRKGLALAAELRIRMQGTKNAYTVLRDHDVVAYDLPTPIGGKEVALGVYLNDRICPLCNQVIGGSDFFIDQTQESFDAQEMKRRESIRRIVSSDRSRGKYIIEEYIDSSVHIPIVDDPTNSAASIANKEQPVRTIPVSPATAAQITSEVVVDAGGGDATDVAIIAAELRVAQLQLQLLKAQRRSGATLTAINSSDAPQPVGPYSQAILANGLLFISGCIGLDPATNQLARGGVEAETNAALRNMRSILAAAGADAASICKTTILLHDIGDYGTVNALYKSFLEQQGVTDFPARSAFAAQLPLGALVEIEAIAAVPPRRSYD